MALPQTPSFRLENRSALVTGGGRGIGLAAAAALAQAGAHVTLCARSQGEIDAGATQIRAAGGLADTLCLDIADVEAVGAALASRPGFDILVNNAGTNRPCAFPDVSAADFDAVIDINLRAAFFTAQAVARGMIREARKGTIIQMSSQMGHVGGARRSVYCASKAALEGLTKAMAIDLAPHGIRVNTIAPTFILTPMTEAFFWADSFRSEVLSKIKLGRLGAVEDLMGAIIFLASDASALMTGSSLRVDGGWTAE